MQALVIGWGDDDGIVYKVRINNERLTEDNDIQNQYNETNNSTTSAILPCVAVVAFSHDWGGCDEREHEELEEHGESLLKSHCEG